MKAILFLFLSIFFISCGNDKKSEGPIEINLTTRYALGQGNIYSKYFIEKVEKFNELNKGKIIVNHEGISVESQYLEKIRTSFTSGKPPHVFQEYGGSRLVDYVEANALLDIKPYLDADPEWRDSFLNLFNKWEYKEYPGIWGIPFKMYALGLFYNEEIFEKYNLEPPKNWDDLEKICATLMANGITPFLPGEKDISRAGHLHNLIVIKSLGVGAVEKLANRTLTYDSPEMIETYRKIKDFIDKGWIGYTN